MRIWGWGLCGAALSCGSSSVPSALLAGADAAADGMTQDDGGAFDATDAGPFVIDVIDAVAMGTAFGPDPAPQVCDPGGTCPTAPPA